MAGASALRYSLMARQNMCTDGGCGFCVHCVEYDADCSYEAAKKILVREKGGMSYEDAKASVLRMPEHLPVCRPGCRTQSGQVNHTFCRECKERHEKYVAMHKKGPSGFSPLEAFELCREVIGNMSRDPETKELLDKLIERGRETPKPPTGRRAAIEATKRKRADRERL